MQTGLLQWPIPVMSAAGLMFFSLGWVMLRNTRKKADKNKESVSEESDD